MGPLHRRLVHPPQAAPSPASRLPRTPTSARPRLFPAPRMATPWPRLLGLGPQPHTRDGQRHCSNLAAPEVRAHGRHAWLLYAHRER